MYTRLKNVLFQLFHFIHTHTTHFLAISKTIELVNLFLRIPHLDHIAMLFEALGNL